MTFVILYHPSVVKKDIPKLSKTARLKIKAGIEKKLVGQPEIYGKPLRKSLKGYRKLRVGDYRVIFRIENSAVYIIIIAHRREVYERAVRRV